MVKDMGLILETIGKNLLSMALLLSLMGSSTAVYLYTPHNSWTQSQLVP